MGDDAILFRKLLQTSNSRVPVVPLHPTLHCQRSLETVFKMIEKLDRQQGRIQEWFLKGSPLILGRMRWVSPTIAVGIGRGASLQCISSCLALLSTLEVRGILRRTDVRWATRQSLTDPGLVALAVHPTPVHRESILTLLM